MEEGRDGQIVENMLKAAVLAVFRERVGPELIRDIIAAFEEGIVANTGEDVPAADEAALVEVSRRCGAGRARSPSGDEAPPPIAAAVEFVLEGCTSRSGSTRTPRAPASVPRPPVSPTISPQRVKRDRIAHYSSFEDD